VVLVVAATVAVEVGQRAAVRGLVRHWKRWTMECYAS
jgi:hypothetical protein